MLSIHTLRVPWAPWGEMGHRPPSPWKESQVPIHLASFSWSLPCHNHACICGNSRPQKQVTLMNSAFSMCLFLLQDLGFVPDGPWLPPAPGLVPPVLEPRGAWPGAASLGWGLRPCPSLWISVPCSVLDRGLQPPPASHWLRTLNRAAALGLLVVSGEGRGTHEFAGVWGVHRQHYPTPFTPSSASL